MSLIVQQFLYSSSLFQITFSLYSLAFFTYLLTFLYYLLTGLNKIQNPSTLLKKYLVWTSISFFVLAFILNLILVSDRWIQAQRPPFRTLYETLIYATLTISLVYLFVEFSFKLRIFGLLVSALILYIFIYSLSQRDVEIATIMPALQTPIMVPHVTSYFFAYAAASIAFLSALLSISIKKQSIPGFWVASDSHIIQLSGYTYKITKFSFLFLTFGILLGSWWGQIAWSDYWGWDPKENWALISWLSFASYFHLKKSKGWSEIKMAWFVIFAFSAILFTYLGMKYLPQDVQEASLHIYIENIDR